jgi:hypothetical protein
VEAGFNGFYHGVSVAIEGFLEFNGFGALDAVDVPVRCDPVFARSVCWSRR